MEYPVYFELEFEAFEKFTKFMGLRNHEVIASAQLSQQDVLKMRQLLPEAVMQYNERANYSHYSRIDLANFGLQYAGFLNKNGEKIIWINGFTLKNSPFCNPNDTSGFESNAVLVLDGGNGYFDTTINLATEETDHIQIHGSA